VKFTLTGEDRFDWVSPNFPEHTFVAERIELASRDQGSRDQGSVYVYGPVYVYLTGPWVTTPERLVGKGDLAVTGWDTFGMGYEPDRARLCGLPDVILIRLGAAGLQTRLLPL
jgi:hypothetical protein